LEEEGSPPSPSLVARDTHAPPLQRGTDGLDSFSLPLFCFFVWFGAEMCQASHGLSDGWSEAILKESVRDSRESRSQFRGLCSSAKKVSILVCCFCQILFKHDNMRHMNLANLNLNSILHKNTFNNHTDDQFISHDIFNILVFAYNQDPCTIIT